MPTKNPIHILQKIIWTQDTQDTTEMMGQLLRSIFTTVWGEEIKTPGLIENRDAEAMNQQHLFDLI